MTADSPSKDSNDWQHLTSLRRNLAFGNRVSLQHHQWNYITSENRPVWSFFGQHSSTGLFALSHARHITDSRDSKDIQEIQRIKNIKTNISLENKGQMKVDVRQRPGYKAVVL